MPRVEDGNTYKTHHKESNRTHVNLIRHLLPTFTETVQQNVHYLKQDYMFYRNLKTDSSCVSSYKPEYPTKELQGIVNTHSQETLSLQVITHTRSLLLDLEASTLHKIPFIQRRESDFFQEGIYILIISHIYKAIEKCYSFFQE